ncbi:MAG: cytochrome c1 [Ramlibacter sp.]
MKKLLFILIAALGLATGARASSEGVTWEKAPNNLNDLTSLQNGAKLFVNYCLNCHSASFMRYNRLRDLELTEQQIKDNMLFATDKVGETMKASIDPKQAKEWFGANPPDLTLVARSRSGHYGTGADYLYTYLRGYYRDPAKATGWDNTAFPNVGMPNVLWELQGDREPQYSMREEHGHQVKTFQGWKQVSPGTMSQLQFDEAVGDLVGYMQWMAEPAQNSRVRVGVWVLLFLGVFTLFAWRLNAAFWKEVN